MSAVTPEERMEKRRKQAQGVAEGKSVNAPDPVAFREAVGAGLPLVIGGKEVEIAAVFLSEIPKAARLFGQLPYALVLHSVAALGADGFSPQATADLINKRRSEGTAEVTADQVARDVAAAGSQMAEEEAQAMLGLAALALRRKQPDMDAAFLDEHMGIPTFLSLLLAFLRENRNFADPT